MSSTIRSGASLPAPGWGADSGLLALSPAPLAPRAGTILSHHLPVSAADGVITPVTTGFYRVVMRRDPDAVWRIADFRAALDIPFQESAEHHSATRPREITPLETPCPTC